MGEGDFEYEREIIQKEGMIFSEKQLRIMRNRVDKDRKQFLEMW